MLKRPTRVTGGLEYRADGVMIRNVASPRPERSEVSGDEVRIARGDGPARRISLQRAPQLRILLSSFRAMLEGRITPLAQDFDISLDGERGSWKLGLRPLDARVAAYLERIDVYGRGPRLHCMEATEPDGDATLTLFGNSGIPALSESRIDIEQFCRAGARAPALDTP